MNSRFAGGGDWRARASTNTADCTYLRLSRLLLHKTAWVLSSGPHQAYNVSVDAAEQHELQAHGEATAEKLAPKLVAL
eukprot:SAG11_NODE_3820_length_2209_cov_1.796209_1_plen_77_part_10